jgi:catenin beta 1
MLAYGNQEGKLIILASGGPQELVRIMSTYSYEKLLWSTSRVLKVLSVCPSNKPAIVQAGGLQALAPHVRSGSSRIQLNTLYTIRNLSDEATAGHEQIGALLRQLLDCLNGTPSGVDDNERLCTAVGALSNLTCNQPSHKQALVQAGAVGALLPLLNSQPEREQVLEPVLCTLRHLCQRHPDAEQAAAVLRQPQPLNQINRLLITSNWCIARATVQLIRALAFDASAHSSLRDTGIAAKLISLLVKTVAELRRQRPPTMSSAVGLDSALISSALTAVQADGVPLLALLEATVGALQLLAKDGATRDCIRSSVDVIPLLIQLLYGDVEPVQRVAVGLLCELATEKEGEQCLSVRR